MLTTKNVKPLEITNRLPWFSEPSLIVCVNICMCVCASVLSNTTMENITSNFSMECGTYEQLGYWPNNFDDFAVSNKKSENFSAVFCVSYFSPFSLFQKELSFTSYSTTHFCLFFVSPLF